jgi:hypothetical protein
LVGEQTEIQLFSHPGPRGPPSRQTLAHVRDPFCALATQGQGTPPQDRAMGQSLRNPRLAGESHQRCGVPLDGLAIPAARLEAGRMVVGKHQGKRMR